MISEKIANKMFKAGVDPESSFESMLDKAEELGYNRIILSSCANGYTCTLAYQGNSYVYKSLAAENREEALANALVWSLTKANECG